MVNEREDISDDEEGEYHFSDDQINYEVEPETASTSKAQDSQGGTQHFKKNLANLSRYKRVIIGVVVFFVLIYVVFKMLAPTGTSVPTEFNPATTKSNATAPQKQPQPQMQQQPMQQPTMPAAPQQLPQMQQPISQPMMPSMPSQQGAMMPPTQQPAATMQNPVMPPSQNMPPQVTVTQPALPASAEIAAEQKNIMDRVAALEEENTKLMNLLQTQFAQKMAEYDSQNRAAQERVHILNKRIANMESSINKIAQILQDEGLYKAPLISGSAQMPAARTAEPKMIYTVQAIIPGRAWLKTDSGETVTVAEGDILKDYGRIVKIDPYDGIVAIDTGSKIITLSYGAGGD